LQPSEAAQKDLPSVGGAALSWRMAYPLFHSRRVSSWPLLVASLVLAGASPALAQDHEGIETLIAGVTPEGDGAMIVDIRLLNGGAETVAGARPLRIDALLIVANARRPVILERIDGDEERAIPAGGFGRSRYRLRLPVGAGENGRAALMLAQPGAQPVLFDLPQPSLATAPVQTAQPSLPTAEPSRAPSDREPGNAFLDNLSPYEAVYAVYGPGTNTEARLQISFKYQLFGSRALEGRPESLLDGLYFAYTQRMFWDLGAESFPFRNIDFQPELFYLSKPMAISDGASVAAQIGFRHESNGRDGLASRSVNTVYVAPMATMPLAGDYRLTVAPRLSLYVGSLEDNPRIERYRGHSGLYAEIGADDGLRLATSTRFNFGSGKGAVSAELSYPLDRLLGGGPDVYLFGQGFTGYGENLLDYDRRTTRLRFGIGLVR